MHATSIRTALAAVLAVGFIVSVHGSAAVRPCADNRPAHGGDWTSYGADRANSRSQPDEHELGPDNAAALTPLWSFWSTHGSGLTAQNFSEFDSTPVEAFGCVYVGSAYSRTGPGGGSGLDANFFALDASTGKPVWQRYLTADPAGTGGAVVAAPVILGRKVVVPVNQAGDGTHGPYLIALDPSTGRTLWQSPPLTTQTGYYTDSSPVELDGVIFIGFSALEGDDHSHGGFALLDAATGKLLKLTYTIPARDWWQAASDGSQAPRYSGGGVWTTAAIDARSHYAYFGTGNPTTKNVQHPRTDAILKVDLDRDRPSFGQVVGDYTGNVEQHIAGHDATVLRTTPLCPSPTDDVIHQAPTLDQRESDLQGIIEDDPVCGQLDLDFGAAANLFTDPHSGALLVGDLQKSGVYHVVRTDTMTDFSYTSDGTPTPSSTRPAWTAEVGESCQLCNSSSTAYDARSRTIFADVAPGTFMVAISAVDGSVRWRTPIGDGAHYESVSYANGVVYTVDNGGRLLAFDADDGTLLLQESLIPAAAGDAPSTGDTGLDSVTFGSGGVSIARHTVFAADGSHIIALRAN